MKPKLIIASASSGSGKTTITCGLLKAFKRRGLSVKAYKCGPDYIDPMFHRQATGTESSNLDSFFADKGQLCRILDEGGNDCDIEVIEGVMGYYDGIGSGTSSSTYEIAKLTDTPVILIMDGKGAALSLAAAVKGFLCFREDNHIIGVILNRTEESAGERLRTVLRDEGVTLYGCIPDSPDIALDSRHLGLVLPGEVEDIQKKIDEMADIVERYIDLNGILKAISGYISSENSENEEYQTVSMHTDRIRPSDIKIAAAFDEAFCFYYQENLRLLHDLGADIIPFSPLHDKKLPKGCSGVILGGGYPENHAGELSSNTDMLDSIRSAWNDKMPFLAECGGFMYLHKELEGIDGSIYPMTGVIDARAYRTGHLNRFGYVTLSPDGTGRGDLKGEVKGHEFHYWDSDDPGDDWTARKPQSERSWKCIHDKDHQIAGFTHLYYPSAPDLIESWLDGARKWGKL